MSPLVRLKHLDAWDRNGPPPHDRRVRLLEPEAEDGAVSRVIRGGSWGGTPDVVRSAVRGGVPPINRVPFLGFRVARSWLC